MSLQCLATDERYWLDSDERLATYEWVTNNKEQTDKAWQRDKNMHEECVREKYFQKIPEKNVVDTHSWTDFDTQSTG